MKLIGLLFLLFVSVEGLAASNSITEIYDQDTANDLRYYPRILQVVPNRYGAKNRKHCPFEELRLLSKQFSARQLRDEVMAMGDLIEPLRYWNLSPECFDKDIHHQIKISNNQIEGLALGVVFGFGEAASLASGIEVVMVKIDEHTLSIGLFIFEGGGFGFNLSPAVIGLMQGVLQGSCPDGVMSYAGGFTNFTIGSDSWSFATGDFPLPALTNKLKGCSSYVKLTGLAAFTGGVSQTFYQLYSPLAYKIRGPQVDRLIEWLKNKKLMLNSTSEGAVCFRCGGIKGDTFVGRSRN